MPPSLRRRSWISRTARDKDGRTSIDTVFAIGDGTGRRAPPRRRGSLPDLPLQSTSARDHRLPRGRMTSACAPISNGSAAFSRRSGNCSGEIPSFPAKLRPGAVVCRCEEVSAGSLADHVLAGAPIGSVKRATRLGMGRCQARYCGPLAVNLLATGNGHCPSELDFPAPRPPTRPVTLAVLAELGRESDCLEATSEPGAGDERPENR